MLTLNDTPLNDNQARFVVKIESDTPIYLSNYLDGITLSSVLYDGAPLVKNSLQDNGKSIDISNGGGIGNIQAFQLQIARYQTNTALNDFFNDLFPATGKQYLIARPISIGFCWEGATTAGEITWFFYGYIDEYSYNADTITLLCLEYAELENIELPPYKLQRENDNGISYFPDAPEDNIGLSLPIIYGDFTLKSGEGTTKNIISPLCPTLLVDETKIKGIVASHECNTSADTYQYIDSLGVKQAIDGFDITAAPAQISVKNNNYAGTGYTLLDGDDGSIIGGIIIYPSQKGVLSPVGDFTFDKLNGLDPYKLDAGDIISFKFGISEDYSINGAFNAQTQVQLKIDFTNTVNPPGASNNIKVLTYSDGVLIDTLNDKVTLSETKTIDFTAIFTITSWDWKKVSGLEFKITNLYSTPGEYIWVDKIYLYNYYYSIKGSYLKKYLEEYTVPLYFLGIPFFKESRWRRIFNTQTVNDFRGVILAAVKGMQYGRWIDNNGAARDNGYNINGLIQQPAYNIESALRDYAYAERDLVVNTKTDTTHAIVNNLKVDIDDYYIGSEWFNVTTNHKSYVTDFVASTNTIVINDADALMADGDKIYLTNVNGNNRIDVTSFDLVGDNPGGLRHGWLIGKYIGQPETVSGIISRICYESFAMIFLSYNQYKLVALDSATSADAWTSCLKIEGRESFSIQLTPLKNIFTSFRLKYAFDHATNKYKEEFYVDKNGYTSGGTVISATEKTLCENAETNYKIKNNFEYSSDWIYDLTTAEYLLQKLVLWFTKQRMMVTWTTPLSDGTVDYIKYELGDQVVLTNTRILPTGISGVKCFMITGKQIIIKRGDPYIIWNLIEMEDLPT